MNQRERNTVEKIAKLAEAKRQGLEAIEARAISRFKGAFTDLESALGMLRLGHHFGWRVIYLVHSKATVRKYEGILGVRVREVFEDAGPSSYRSVGFELARTVGNFWKIVSGAVKLKGRRQIER
jgi:hypothetical protein